MKKFLLPNTRATTHIFLILTDFVVVYDFRLLRSSLKDNLHKPRMDAADADEPAGRLRSSAFIRGSQFSARIGNHKKPLEPGIFLISSTRVCPKPDSRLCRNDSCWDFHRQIVQPVLRAVSDQNRESEGLAKQALHSGRPSFCLLS